MYILMQKLFISCEDVNERVDIIYVSTILSAINKYNSFLFIIRKESENVFADASYFNRIADRGNQDFGEASNQKSTSLLIGKQTNARLPVTLNSKRIYSCQYKLILYEVVSVDKRIVSKITVEKFGEERESG